MAGSTKRFTFPSTWLGVWGLGKEDEDSTEPLVFYYELIIDVEGLATKPRIKFVGDQPWDGDIGTNCKYQPVNEASKKALEMLGFEID